MLKRIMLTLSMTGFILACGGGDGDPSEDSQCTAMAVCDPGSTQIANEAACPADAACAPTTTCGTTIWCAQDTAECLALPVCKGWETEVASEADCPQDGGECYESTMCGTTIWCAGPEVCEAVPECKAGEAEVNWVQIPVCSVTPGHSGIRSTGRISLTRPPEPREVWRARAAQRALRERRAGGGVGSRPIVR